MLKRTLLCGALLFALPWAMADHERPIEVNELAKIGENETFFLYKTIPNDSLWNITERHLVDLKLWTKLRDLNSSVLEDADHIETGTILKIPHRWLKKHDAEAKLTALKGEVELHFPDGESERITPEDLESGTLSLPPETRLTTQKGGLATVEFSDGSQLLLQSESELLLEELHRYGDGSLTEMMLNLERGRIENSIPVSIISNTNYEVTTMRGTTAVRGTQFRVSGDEGRAITEVLEGAVNAVSKDHQKALDLSAGKGIIMSENEADFAPITLLPPPELHDIPALIEEEKLAIELPEKEEISGYSALVVPFGGDIKAPISSAVSSEPLIVSDRLPDGRYHLIVSAIDQKGVTGEPARADFILNARPYRPAPVMPQLEEKVLAKALLFEWEPKDEAYNHGYFFQIADEPQFKMPLISEPQLSEARYTTKQPLPAGEYYWRVAALDEEKKRGPFSEPQSFRVLLEKPALNDSYIHVSDITLEWQPLEEGTQYRVQLAESPAFEEPLIDETLEEATLKVERIIPKTYYFRVQTIARDGYIDQWSEPTKVNVPDRYRQ